MITGEQVYLVPMSEEFAAQRAAWMNQPRVRRHLALPQPIDTATTRAWAAGLADDPRRLDFIICIKTSKAAIGYVGFREINPAHRRAEIYLGLGEPGGLGHAAEALALALSHAFGALALHKVYARIRTNNRLALSLAQRIGGHLDGILRDEVFANGRFHDIAILSLLASEHSRPS